MNNIQNASILIAIVAILIACGGSQNDQDQATSSDTGAVALTILFAPPGDADRVLQSLDACDDAEWVMLSILDENGTVLKASENWPCKNRQGTLTGVPKGDRRRAIVRGVAPDGQTLLYWGISGFFTVEPDIENPAGTIIAKPIADADQDGDGYTPNEGDCADADNTIHPGAKDLCNDEIDQDCNPDTCEPRVWYADRDNDSFGSAADTATGVQCPDHYVADSRDCNDNDSSVHPNAGEQCNGRDDDCDGIRDEGCPWNKTYDEDGDVRPRSIIQTRDGGYLISAMRDIGPEAVTLTLLLIKLDEIGNRQWTIEQHGVWVGMYTPAMTIQSDDGGFVATGEKDGAVWLMKMDENGEKIIFNKTFSENGKYDEGLCVLESAEGGYVITGEGYNDSGEGAFLIKTDKDGNKIQDTFFAKTDASTRIRAAIQTDDGGYLLAGHLIPDNNSPTLSTYPYLIKTDVDGKEVWRSIITEFPDWLTERSVFQAEDGGYILSGQTGTVLIFFKTDKQGNYQWRKQLSVAAESIVLTATDQTRNGGYILTGFDNYDELEDEFDAWIIKADKDFKIEWQKKIGGDLSDKASDICQSNDGGYVILGETHFFDENPQSNHEVIKNFDFWIIKTDVNGNAPLLPQ